MIMPHLFSNTTMGDLVFRNKLGVKVYVNIN